MSRWQQDRKNRALARLALDFDLPMMHVDNLFDDEEAQPQTADIRRGNRPFEPIEDRLQLVPLNADSMVPDREAHSVSRLLDPHFDRLSLAILQGIAQKIDDDLLHPEAVAFN